MVRVFYGQKTEQLIKKIELIEWRERLHEKLSHNHQDLSDNWKMCALGERIKIEGRDLQNIDELSPEARLLGYEFSIAIQKRDGDAAIKIIEKIEKLPTIWND
jgi:hypothetical protein